jgi:hypothetical protein
MVAKIEVGATGARFPTIERLAKALSVDPAELFSAEIPRGALSQGAFGEILSRLLRLNETELAWVKQLLDAALREQLTKPTQRIGGVLKRPRLPRG